MKANPPAPLKASTPRLITDGYARQIVLSETRHGNLITRTVRHFIEGDVIFDDEREGIEVRDGLRTVDIEPEAALARLSRQLERDTRMLAEANSGLFEERVLRHLDWLWHNTPRGTRDGEGERLVLISHEDLATDLGTTRETISHEFTSLRTARKIRTGYYKITLRY